MNNYILHSFKGYSCSNVQNTTAVCSTSCESITGRIINGAHSEQNCCSHTFFSHNMWFIVQSYMTGHPCVLCSCHESNLLLYFFGGGYIYATKDKEHEHL